jgi:hypothetical protein
VTAVKPPTEPSIVLRRPKLATRNPAVGVTMAVARMLNVVLQAISSAVAAIDPCICGNMADATSRVVE